jgi:aerobic C4-dicarboxylate transport protein
MVLILGVDWFMAQARAMTNLVGNGVATIIVAKWENEFDAGRAKLVLNEEVPEPLPTPPAPTPVQDLHRVH